MNFDKIAADNTFDAILIFTANEKKIIYVNRAFSKIYGYTSSEALGASLELIEQEHTNTKVLEQQLSFGIHFFLESIFYRKNGQEIHILAHYAPILDENGNITHWVATHQQNLEHKKFQSSISRISSYLNMVVENAPINVWAIDMQGIVQLMMGALLLPPNMTPADSIGKSVFDIYDDNPKLLADIRNALDAKTSSSINVINGNHFESYFAQLNDNNGQCIGLIIVSININERAEAEDIKFRLSSILEATTDFVGTSNSDGEISAYINSAGIAMLGYNAKELESIPIKALHPDWAFKIIQEVGIPEAIKNGVWSGETALLSSTKEEIPVSQVIIAHKTADGKLHHLSTIARDIRDTKINERRLLEAKEKAEAATKAKTEFLANISHEIRTPLNAILGFSEILSKSTTDQALKNYAQLICDSGRNLLLLLNDILDLSKIESGKLELKNQITSTQEILAEIKSMFSMPSHAKGLQLQVDVPAEKKYIEVDSTRLRQILFNLVGNAIKYTKKGSVHLSAQEIYNENHQTVTLVFEVKDTGQGIEKEDQAKIFEDFFQKHDHAGGAGLGLSISQRLAQMMGGTISQKAALKRVAPSSLQYQILK